MINLNSIEKKLFDLLLNLNNQKKLNLTLRVAGGWVRDKLLKLESNDIDIALDKMNG